MAKLLGLSYPGGPRIEALARDGDPTRYSFPRPMVRADQSPVGSDYFDFSFSGLKTAVAEQVGAIRERSELEVEKADVAASFQQATIDVLVTKTMRAVETTGCERVLLGGGVAANQALRSAMRERLGPEGRLFQSSPRLSVDNGAMVARCAAFRLANGDLGDEATTAEASLPFPVLPTAEA